MRRKINQYINRKLLAHTNAMIRTRISHYKHFFGLNAACPYFTMFPLDFPLSCLEESKPGENVIDPFCGRGTSLYAARIKGLKSIGVDSNPVAVAIAKAKLVYANADEVVNLCKRIINDSTINYTLPEGEFWNLCFHNHNLKQLCRLRGYFIHHKEDDASILLRAIVMGTLHGPRLKTTTSYISNQMPRTYATKPSGAVKYWEKHGLKPNEVDIVEIVRKKASLCLNKIPPRTLGRVIQGDSRNIKIKSRFKADWIITSPPYYGMRSYVSDQWLRYWVIGGPENVVYTLPENIQHTSTDIFKKDLALVWDSVARFSKPGARLIVRFGVLPSVRVNANEIIIDSLKKSTAPWLIKNFKNAGSPQPHKRQANQFTMTGSPINEIDLYARLEM